MTLEGKLLEISPGEFVKIQTDNGHIIQVSDHKIKRYYYPNGQFNVEKELGMRNYHFREKGLYLYSSMGLIMNTVSSDQGGRVGWQLSGSAGYQVNRLLGLGFGVGVDFYRTGASEMIFPVFAEVRGYFVSQTSTPYYVLRSGYGIAFANDDVGINEAKGGLMLNPAVGWRLAGGSGLKMCIDIGVQFQHAEFDYSRGSETSLTDIWYKRLNMRVGFLL
jgi:hypothetical protein